MLGTKIFHNIATARDSHAYASGGVALSAAKNI